MAAIRRGCFPKLIMNWQIYTADCLEHLQSMESNSVDALITSPPYPGIKRDYGTWQPDEWLVWMHDIMTEARRVVKPAGSAIVIIQPNYERIGKMNTWPYQFALDMAELWGIVQDAYWIKLARLPTAGATVGGLMRSAVEWCLWLGEPDCWRDQKSVLWEYSDGQMDIIRNRAKMVDKRVVHPSGSSVNFKQFANDNGGATPMNYLPCNPAGYDNHPACYPVRLIEFWVQYVCPKGGVVLDCFNGSGTTGVACLRQDRHYIGIELDAGYAAKARKRLATEQKKYPFE